MGLVSDFGVFSRIAALSPYSLVPRFDNRSAPPNDLSYVALPPREPITKPKNWTTVLMPFEGTYVPCFVSRAEHEDGIVGISTGMSSTPLSVGWNENIERLNANNKTVISIGLHHTADYKSYYDVNRRLIEAFFFDQDCSPLFSIGNKDLDITAMTHSTSSPLFLDTISRPFALERKPERLSNAIHITPLIDTYHSSEGHYPVRNKLFAGFLHARGSHELGESGIEQLIAGKEETSHRPEYGRPECARIGPTRKRIREFTGEVLRGEREDTSMFPQKMYFAERDKLICRYAGERLASKMGIETQSFDGDHYSLFRNVLARQNILRRIEAKHVREDRHYEKAAPYADNHAEELRRFSLSD